jgi:hypothetical protein
MADGLAMAQRAMEGLVVAGAAMNRQT